MAAGVRMVEAKPLFGFGLDRYRAEAAGYFRQPADIPMVGYYASSLVGVPQEPLPLHNTYLAYAVELGLVGVTLWLAALLWAVLGAVLSAGPPSLRPWKLGLVAVTVCVLVVSLVNPHEPPFAMLLLLVWAGVASARPAVSPAVETRAPAAGTGSLPLLA
jgi:O-antigen ligase